MSIYKYVQRLSPTPQINGFCSKVAFQVTYKHRSEGWRESSLTPGCLALSLANYAAK